MQARTQAESQASVEMKFQTLGLSSLDTDDIVIILEQVYLVGPVAEIGSL